MVREQRLPRSCRLSSAERWTIMSLAQGAGLAATGSTDPAAQQLPVAVRSSAAGSAAKRRGTEAGPRGIFQPQRDAIATDGSIVYRNENIFPRLAKWYILNPKVCMCVRVAGTR